MTNHERRVRGLNQPGYYDPATGQFPQRQHPLVDETGQPYTYTEVLIR